MPKWLSDFPKVRVNSKRLLPLDTISFFSPVTAKRAHLFQKEKKKKKSFFLQGGQQCGACLQGLGLQEEEGHGRKECFKERQLGFFPQGPTPATAERKRQVGEKGNVSLREGGGGWGQG